MMVPVSGAAAFGCKAGHAVPPAPKGEASALAGNIFCAGRFSRGWEVDRRRSGG